MQKKSPDQNSSRGFGEMNALIPHVAFERSIGVTLNCTFGLAAAFAVDPLLVEPVEPRVFSHWGQLATVGTFDCGNWFCVLLFFDVGVAKPD